MQAVGFGCFLGLAFDLVAESWNNCKSGVFFFWFYSSVSGDLCLLMERLPWRFCLVVFCDCFIRSFN
jgi:hypothetical protein